MKRVRTSTSLLLMLAAASPGVGGQQAQGSRPAGFETPGELLTALYGAVSTRDDTPQDWAFVRSMFLDEASVVLRTSRTATTVFDVDGFIEDFRQFMELPGPKGSGFTERIVQMRPWIYRDMAHVLVLYEAMVPGSSRPPSLGLDSFLLVRRDGRWWVAAITNEVVDAEHPVPEELR